MKDLSKHRSIFHSEADFQHALAWEIQKAIPDCEIRLELPYRVLDPQSDETDKNHLDIYLPTEGIAVELKYRPRGEKDKWNNELFVLKNQSAHNLGRHSFLKDIARIERVVADGEAKSGFAVLLTNDPLYWDQTRSRKPNPNDADFHIHEGRRITGYLAWSDNTAEKTKKEYPPFDITGSYRMHWRDYSQQFRYLAVSVRRGLSR